MSTLPILAGGPGTYKS